MEPSSTLPPPAPAAAAPTAPADQDDNGWAYGDAPPTPQSTASTSPPCGSSSKPKPAASPVRALKLPKAIEADLRRLLAPPLLAALVDRCRRKRGGEEFMPDSTAVSVLRGVRGFLAPLLDLLGPSEPAEEEGGDEEEQHAATPPPPPSPPLPLPLPDVAALAEAIRRHAEEVLEAWAVRGGQYEANVRVLFAFLAGEQLELEVESGNSAVNKLLGTRQACLWDRRPGLERSRLAAATVQMEELIMAQPQEEAGRPQRERRGLKRWAEEFVVGEGGGSKRGRKERVSRTDQEKQEPQGQQEQKAEVPGVGGGVVGGVAGGGSSGGLKAPAAAAGKRAPATFAECRYRADERLGGKEKQAQVTEVFLYFKQQDTPPLDEVKNRLAAALGEDLAARCWAEATQQSSSASASASSPRPAQHPQQQQQPRQRDQAQQTTTGSIPPPPPPLSPPKLPLPPSTTTSSSTSQQQPSARGSGNSSTTPLPPALTYVERVLPPPVPGMQTPAQAAAACARLEAWRVEMEAELLGFLARLLEQ